ncbi:hypothetical protein PpBr36_01966 [Pyricularia pennisetigena]|uniref:hypothetical protein n=1 Tax=Pyricularia pennisetigena TaxID=1578925 RepID=UPI001151C219|nr:hypothetical protein PpBr36_01966 [Pyricularia pennisetigena]TLS28378.1 hypothetical protein PpBr36_01966 [Pyricularia pennisetigena]
MNIIDSDHVAEPPQPNPGALKEDRYTNEKLETVDKKDGEPSVEDDPFGYLLAVIRAKLDQPSPDDPLPCRSKTDTKYQVSDNDQRPSAGQAPTRTAKPYIPTDAQGSSQLPAAILPIPVIPDGGEMTLASELQQLIQSEKALDAAALYKRRRIASSELLVNTRYYAARTCSQSTVDPARADFSLSFSTSFQALSQSQPQAQSGFQRNILGQQPSNGFDLISSLASYSVLAIEFIKYLHPRDILTVYSISRVFHANWNANEHYFCRILACHLDPTAARAYPWELYRDYLIRNPRGYIVIDYTQPDFRRGIDIDNPTPWSRMVLSRGSSAGHAPLQLSPGSKLCLGMAWINMLFVRERQARDIVASLARKGHRVPSSARSTIRKLWTVTDCPTNRGRHGLARAWTDEDLLNAQLLFLKLDLMFNDAVQGPGTPDLRRLMLGQPGGVRVLWQLLRRRRFVADLLDLRQLQLLFEEGAATAEQCERGLPVAGVPVELFGVMRCEGWGRGGASLVQPDELVSAECVRRRLRVDKLLVSMVAWGCVDFETGQNLVPTVQELYMSDDDDGGVRGIQGPITPPGGLDTLAGSVPLEEGDWRPHHAMRAVFDTLTPEQQQAVIAAEEDEELVAQAWEDDSSMELDESGEDVDRDGDDDDDDDDVMPNVE